MVWPARNIGYMVGSCTHVGRSVESSDLVGTKVIIWQSRNGKCEAQAMYCVFVKRIYLYYNITKLRCKVTSETNHD
mgnify:CR=1 FL=1